MLVWEGSEEAPRPMRPSRRRVLTVAIVLWFLGFAAGAGDMAWQEITRRSRSIVDCSSPDSLPGRPSGRPPFSTVKD